MSALLGRNVKQLQKYNNRLLLAPLQRTIWNDPRQAYVRRRILSPHTCRSLPYLQQRSFCAPQTNPSTTTPVEKKSGKKQTSLQKAINGTKTAVITIIRIFTHPVESWAGFKEGWHHFVDTLKHYWKGTKLLWADVKACGSILFRLLRGHRPSWREQRQLFRTTMDILRFIPMFFFIVVPFLEFLLPVALYLFPNMLPSTFSTSHQREERRKKVLQARLKSAEFLSNIHSKYLERLEDDADLTVSKNILKKFQRTGGTISSKELEKILPHFRDHITLDSLNTNQLKSLCHFLHLNPFGFTDATLRERLRKRLKYIRKEDAGIAKSGVETISSTLLKELIQERGMRVDKSEEELRSDLLNWIELTQNKKIPTSLLLLSRTLMINVNATDTNEMLKTTIKVIPDAVDEVLVDAVHDDDPSLEKKVIDRQSKLIKEERDAKKKDPQDYIPVEDLQTMKKEVKETARERVVTILKTTTDDSAVEAEKKQLEDLKVQHSKQKAKIAKTEVHLKDWTVLLGLETELTSKCEVDKDQVRSIWNKEKLDPSRFDVAFETWDVNQNTCLTTKRCKQFIDEEKQRAEEILASTIQPDVQPEPAPKLSEILVEEEGTERQVVEKENKDEVTKKSAEKVSKKLQKMFDKLEKEIELSEKSLGEALHLAKEGSKSELREIVENNCGNEVPQEILDEIMQQYDDDQLSIKQQIEASFNQIQDEMSDEENEELDVSDVDTDHENEVEENSNNNKGNLKGQTTFTTQKAAERKL